MYEFRSINDVSKIFGTSKMLFFGMSGGIEAAKFRGSLISLFGEPPLKTDNSEDAYSYIIDVTSNNNEQWIFTVYCGSSGPAIGFDMKGDHKKARNPAEYLLKTIMETKPANFQETLISKDFNTEIQYGCKDGECFYHEE